MTSPRTVHTPCSPEDPRAAVQGDGEYQVVLVAGEEVEEAGREEEAEAASHEVGEEGVEEEEAEES